eukprot:Gb_17302 [translate_table: standard]
MKRVFGVKKEKVPPPSIQDATERINKRGDTVDEKLKKLDVELARYREQIKRTRPGPAQEAVKARAMRILKQKRMSRQYYLPDYLMALLRFCTKCLPCDMVQRYRSKAICITEQANNFSRAMPKNCLWAFAVLR